MIKSNRIIDQSDLVVDDVDRGTCNEHSSWTRKEGGATNAGVENAGAITQ